jgi:hypothetical protein
MKVRVCFTVEVDEQFRRALAAYYSQPGLANRKDIKQWYVMQAKSNDPGMQFDGERAAEADAAEEGKP